MEDLVTQAFNEFMTRLFGEVPKNPSELTVERDLYTKHMHEVQNKYGLEQGHPDFLEWILTITGRSPHLTKEGDDHSESTATTEAEALGETSPSTTDRE